jgi:hypothetical protein
MMKGCALLSALATVVFAVASSTSNQALAAETALNQSCSQSQINAEQFADAINAIAQHGTLLDIPFIERALNVTFDSEPVTEGGVPNPHRHFYSAPTISGLPIKPELDVNDDPDQQRERRGIGIFRFYNFDRAADCLGLTRDIVVMRIKGQALLSTGLRPPPPPRADSDRNGVDEIKVRNIIIIYKWRYSDGVVIEMTIRQ